MDNLRYGLVDDELVCINVIVWDGITNLDGIDETRLVRSDRIDIGDQCEMVDGVLIFNAPTIPNVLIGPRPG